jgi:hypothetical protein
MTIQALGVACRQSAALVRAGSVIRVAALAQPVPYAGAWSAVRIDWSSEPGRAAEWRDGLPHTNPRGVS